MHIFVEAFHTMVQLRLNDIVFPGDTGVLFLKIEVNIKEFRSANNPASWKQSVIAYTILIFQCTFIFKYVLYIFEYKRFLFLHFLILTQSCSLAFVVTLMFNFLTSFFQVCQQVKCLYPPLSVSVFSQLSFLILLFIFSSSRLLFLNHY